MKRIIPVLLTLMLLTACQTTPEEEFVGFKGQPQASAVQTSHELSTQDTATPEMVSALYEKLGVPTLWRFSTDETGFLLVAEDVPIDLPPVDKVAVVEAELRSIDKSDVDALAAALFQGRDIMWHDAGIMTREEIAGKIDMLQTEIAELEGEHEANAWLLEHKYRDLESWQNDYASAPFSSELEHLTLELVPKTDSHGSHQGFSVKGLVDGETWFGACSADGSFRRISFGLGNDVMSIYAGMGIAEPFGVKLGCDEAISKAKQIAEALTDELSMCYAAPCATFKANTNRNWAWQVVFMREVNGVPTAYASENIGEDMESSVAAPVAYERLVVSLDDFGCCAVSWQSPMKLTGIVTADAELLPFNEITARAVEQIKQRWSYEFEKDPAMSAAVTRVEFGLWRVVTQDGAYRYIPVWHFFTEVKNSEEYIRNYYKDGHTGWEEYIAEYAKGSDGDIPSQPISDPRAWGAVTVNAIDGTIIDKDKGY